MVGRLGGKAAPAHVRDLQVGRRCLTFGRRCLTVKEKTNSSPRGKPALASTLVQCGTAAAPCNRARQHCLLTSPLASTAWCSAASLLPCATLCTAASWCLVRKLRIASMLTTCSVHGRIGEQEPVRKQQSR